MRSKSSLSFMSVLFALVFGGCAVTVSSGEAPPADASAGDVVSDRAPARDPLPDVVTPVGDASVATHIAGDNGLTCAIGGDARVRCWGRYAGFVYSATRDAGDVPTLIPGIEGATALAASSDHACAVVRAGEVRCWGFNTWAQLGLPRENPDDGPAFHSESVRIEGLPPARAVAVGWLHSCALLMDGRVACWGHDGLSQMPVPVSRSVGYTTTPVVAPDVDDVVQLDAHGSNTCARRRDGTLRCWGENAFGESGPRDNSSRVHTIALGGVTDVFAAQVRSFALGADGTVYRWGAVRGTTPGDGLPRAVGTLAGATRIVTLMPKVCALGADGRVRCLAELTDMVEQREVERVIERLAPSREVVVGRRHACAIDLAGGVYCHGENPAGEVGVGTRGNREAPAARAALRAAVRVVRGYESACAITDAGLYCWGGNRAGDVGVGGDPYRAQSVPARVALEGVTDVAAKIDHACAVSHGAVYCWGGNTHGEVSPGGAAVVTTPTRVPLPAVAREVTVGDAFACARTDGGVYCWGDNTRGQVADARYVTSHEPSRVALPGEVARVAAGSAHTCALVRTGEVYCWGYNRSGELGDPRCDARCLERIRGGDAAHARVEIVPQRVAGVTGAQGLAVGGSSCAFDAAGASCWPVGDGVGRVALAGAAFVHSSTGNVAVCARAPGACVTLDGMRAAPAFPPIERFTDLAFDANSGCAINGAREVLCWGDGARGQLGTGDGYYASPVPVRW